MTDFWVGEVTRLNFAEIIREAEAAAIHELRQQLKRTEEIIVTRESLWEAVTCGTTRLFIAVIPREDGGEIVGMVFLCSVVKSGTREDQLEELVVHEDYRDLDIGKKLLETAIEFSYTQGARHISLTTEAIKRPGAAHLYATHGFELERDKVVFRHRFR